MGLRDIVPVTVPVKVGDKQEFQVSGISVQQLSSLLTTNKTEVNALITSGMDIKSAVLEYPEFVARMIAMASGDEGAIEQAKALPMGVQIDALSTIWELTIPDPSVVGKLLALVGVLVRKLVESPEFLNLKAIVDEMENQKKLGKPGSAS
jgi:hypothetical protein